MSMLWRSGRLSTVKVPDVERHAEAYGIEISCDGEGEDRRILVPETTKGFKALLDLLNQNYFPGIFDGEKYVANSKRPI
jgi:signal transduction histidine kinase